MYWFCFFLFLGVDGWTKSLENLLAPSEQATASTLEKRLTEHIKFSTTTPNQVGYIAIDDHSSGINESTWLFVQTSASYYKKTKPICIILDLNTPGGEVFAAQKISDALKEMDTQEEIPVVAFINNSAVSLPALCLPILAVYYDRQRCKYGGCRTRHPLR